jgi:hypothetical protein
LEKSYQEAVEKKSFNKIIDFTDDISFLVFHNKDYFLQYNYHQFSNTEKIKEFPIRKIDLSVKDNVFFKF